MVKNIGIKNVENNPTGIQTKQNINILTNLKKEILSLDSHLSLPSLVSLNNSGIFTK